MGQNLAASAGYKQTGQQVVDAWMSEEKDYNPSNPTYSHFTRELRYIYTPLWDPCPRRHLHKEASLN